MLRNHHPSEFAYNGLIYPAYRCHIFYYLLFNLGGKRIYNNKATSRSISNRQVTISS